VNELRVSEAAALSVLEQSDYYRQQVDGLLAARWESAIDEAVRSLLQWPERGTPCRFHSETLTGLRWILVPGFPKHMIFYRHLRAERAVLIVQVLHGARNIEAIVADEEDAK
jgi:plasmid stabilization system protein ParE